MPLTSTALDGSWVPECESDCAFSDSNSITGIMSTMQMIAFRRACSLIAANPFVGAPGGRALASHVVIHGELVRMRAEAQRIVFFLFHVDPVGDEAFVEDIAAQQKR